ncbi:FLYWCH-type domain-containing protein [Aphis craccivora]|uniref:FLYWCH-type domain-containing protein n=1 Tax=Aphis craccivora TaxID=307492 RepID=A0A6G0Y4Q8_APHCR|nr:FLYWCH-type domain-containing protein [Aphis craccivora]
MENCQIIKELILHKTNKYRFRRQRKDGIMKWLCTNKDCSASILTTADKKSICEFSGEHICDENSVQKIERQILRENCKIKCEEDLSTKSLKIIRTELITYSNRDSQKRHKNCEENYV